MKPRFHRSLPQAFVVCIAPLLACATASASVTNFNESNTTNVWALPAGTNLLSGAAVSPATPNTHESSSGTWAVLTDGILGAPGNNPEVVTPNNGDTVTYALDLTAHSAGYDVTSFDSYATWGDSGRDNQDFTIQYSTVANPGNFISIATVSNHDASTDKATHTNLSETTGILASGVANVRIVFGSPNGQENGYVGYSEFVLQGTPSNVNTLAESNTTNSWTLPAGTNLLNGATAIPLTLPSREFSSTNWTTVTNGIIGAAVDTGATVTPLNNTSVVFPLNTAVNFNGYNISSIDTYAAWVNSGRDNQDITISYATVDAPTVFLPIGTAVVHTSSDNATHARLTPVSGFLASRVNSIKFDFGIQENGYVGIREFIALGSAVSISDPLTWTGGSGSAGNATWSTSPDNNWKKTLGGAASNFTSLGALTFDNAGTNRSITVAALTASSMTFANSAGYPYAFGGGLLTVSNDIASSGNGSATFYNAVDTATGVSLSGSGTLVFNGALQSPGLTLAGPGGITLNAANPALSGSAAVSAGTLTVANNQGLQSAGLSMTGGLAAFTSAAPVVASISSLAASPGSIVLGEASGGVNTNLTVGDASSIVSFAGTLSQAVGTTGSLTKTGGSSLTLSGENTYTGTTTVSGGVLQLTQRLALYDGTAASWTASNIVVGSGGTLGFNVGAAGEFTDSDLNTDLSLGGFQPGSTLGITNNDAFTLSGNLTQPGMGLLKDGTGQLNLTGTNTSNGITRVYGGTLNAASTSGTSIGGSIIMGDASQDITLNMGASNQLGAGCQMTFTNGNFYQSKINLRGTDQAVSGLDAAPYPANKIDIIQNDEVGEPGYVAPPAAASLTINAASDHSFFGIIRDMNGAPLSVIKNGAGTQELVNIFNVQSYGYTGNTTINEGTLKLNFASGYNGFGSNVLVNSAGTLYFHQINGDLGFDREISGAGHVVVDGINAVRITSNNNTWSGGTTVGVVDHEWFGYLALEGGNPVGASEGNVAGGHCAGGLMTPSNVITVNNGATLAIDGIAPLGQSGILPQYGLSIRITENSSLSGGSNTTAFVTNITLDGGMIHITNGGNAANFGTDLALVGTLVVGGSSSVPAVIDTPVAGPYANASLGSNGLPGTVFQVADVTSSSATDLTVSSILRNISTNTSPLTKTGPGTMLLSGANTYTGVTTILEGELIVSGDSIADTNQLVINGGKLGIITGANEVVDTLVLGSTQQVAGTYGSTSSTATHQDDSHFAGTGILTVNTSPVVTDPYDVWSAQITDPAQRGRTADPDGDGFTNEQEYLFGTSPTAATGSLTSLESTPAGLVVHWNQRASGSSVYALQESTTLMGGSWSASTATITDSAVQDLTDYVRKQALIPLGSPRKFVRVQASE